MTGQAGAMDGAGGLINISQRARKVVYAGTCLNGACEIAPGVDLARDVLAHRAFRSRIEAC